MSYVYPVGGTGANPVDNQYDALTIAADTTLQWPFSFTDSALVTAQIMHVTASVGGLSLLLPDASQASVGQSVIIKNQGANSFTVKNNAGGTILMATAGVSYFIYITDNSTVAGVWANLTFGAGSSSVSASALAGNGLEAAGSLLQVDTPGSYRNSNFTLGTNDRGNTIIWTGGAGTITIPSAASLGGSGYIVFFSNQGTGNVAFTPSGGELINGAASFTFAAGNSGVIICGAQTGREFVVVGFGQSVTFAFTQLIKDVSGNSTVTLTAAEQANKLIRLIGTITGSFNVIVATTPDFFVVTNATTGAFVITVKTAAGSGVIASAGLSRTMICDGTNVLYANDVGSGTVTSVATGTGLTGGPITNTGTVALANTTVTAGAYGGSAGIPSFTVDAQGRLTAAANTTAGAFSDSAFRVQDNGDATKQLAFEVSGVTTGTTRTMTVPNVDGTLVTTGDTSTVTATMLANSAVNLAGAKVTGTLPVANGGTALTALEATVASAATVDLGAQVAPNVNVTGTTTITSFGTVASGTTRRVIFAGALTLTHNATSLIIPGGASITTAAGDNIIAVSLGSGNWRVTEYNRATPSSNITILAKRTPGAVTTDLLTGIPAGVRRVTISFLGLTKAGTGDFNIQIGPSGGVATSGYAGVSRGTNVTAGMAFGTSWAALGATWGTVILNLAEVSSNTWVWQGSPSGGGFNTTMGGGVALSGALERILITDQGGTPGNFSAGSWQASYE